MKLCPSRTARIFFSKSQLGNTLTWYSISIRIRIYLVHGPLLWVRCLINIITSITATMITTPATAETTMNGSRNEFVSTNQCNAIRITSGIGYTK